jgi:hypothetical protein
MDPGKREVDAQDVWGYSITCRTWQVQDPSDASLGHWCAYGGSTWFVISIDESIVW